MNTVDIPFNTIFTSLTTVNDSVTFEDLTTAVFILSGITEDLTPISLTISWGDGSVDKYENSVFKNYRETSIFGEVLYNKFSSIFAEHYTHIYSPSVSARFKKLSAEVMVEYSNGDIASLIQPIEITSGDFYETIGDVKLIKTNLLPLSGNNKQFMLATEIDGFLIETES